MPVITITSGAKSGGTALATAVAEHLGYRRLNREIILDSTRRYNIDEKTLETELNSLPGFWQRLRRQQHRFIIFVKCSLLQAAKEGNLVYYGPAGHAFLGEVRHVLKVRLEAPLERRLEAVMKETGADRDQAARHLSQADNERRRWISFFYDKDWSDPRLYDLTIRLDNVSLESARDIICRAVGLPEFQATAESAQELRNRSLESEVMAAIAADDKLWNLPLSVTADGDTVVVRGEVSKADQERLIQDIVPQVKGVAKCEVLVNPASNPLPGGAPWRD